MALVSATTKVQIISKAFLLLGEPNPVLDLDATPTTSAASQLYDLLVQELLTSHIWRFALFTVELNQTTSDPENDYWQNQFQLPANYLTMVNLYKDGQRDPWIDYQIFGDKIWTNQTAPLYCVYLYDPGPANYPAYYIQLLVYKLAALIAMNITQNDQLATLYTELSEKYMTQAVNRDEMAMPSLYIKYNPFFNAHYGL